MSQLSRRLFLGPVWLLALGTAGCAADMEAVASTSAGGASTTPATPSGGTVGAGTSTPVAEAYLIDDFEDGDGSTLIGGGWYYYTDEANGGGSTLTIPDAPDATPENIMMTGEGYESELSLSVAYAFDQGTLSYAPYVGVAAWLAPNTEPLDISAYGSLTYTYRGGAHTVRIQTYNVTDFDYFGVAVAAADDWTTVTLPFEQFAQEGWGTATDFDRTKVESVSFQMRGATGETGTLQLDDLALYGTPTTSVPVPDLALNEPAPPAEVELASMAIDNPLQARAMQYLNRGYNITNWLEQTRFVDFTYDEAFVEQLAAAGFESLRLPVDFDLYAESVSGSGDSLSFTLNDDLFTVLDAFEAWTAEHGLSLTIDYHQYDKSISMSDTQSLDLAVALWGKVAEHFADNEREDLFLELLNEPELAMGVSSVSQADWTALAERMIDAIRAHDTTHSVLFGDVKWYGIDALVSREPLMDDNVIYVVHNYEPFIFTHQGASWANMASTHDLPYPYSVDRWSEYSSDFGFNSSMESWILQAVASYYQTGNRTALLNHLATAKRWAVEHNVPVICNEFGAYDARSRLEDRVNYYTDIIGVFEELEIPWQHWFMILDADGNVNPPEYSEPFGLD